MQIRVISKLPHTFNTKSNRKIIQKKGKKHTLVNVKKRAGSPKCGTCHKKLNGVLSRRPSEFKRLKKTERTVARIKGGIYCGNCVKMQVITEALQ